MQYLLRILLCIAAAASLQAAVPILDPKITGTSSQVASGTFTVKAGATLATESGTLFSFAEKLNLASGGTGVSLSDPGADRVMFWDDSAGSVAWLTFGTGLSISGTTATVDSTLFAPADATFITSTAASGLSAEFALGTLATGILKNTTTTGIPTIAAAGTDYVAPGAVTTSGLTMATARLLGRTTASTGGVEEITVGSGLSLASGTLTASGTGDVVGPASATDNAIARFDSTTGKLIQNSAVTLSDTGAFSFPDGVKQTFNPDATTAGLNPGAHSGDPSSLANGDLWYNSSSEALKARVNGATITLGSGDVTVDPVWDAKGDLIVGTGANTAAKLSIGANGTIPIADSSQATGIRWDTVSGTGDVAGPASSVDARLALFDSTTGKLLKQSTALTESGGTITSNTAIGLTAGGTNQNITFLPSGTGRLRSAFNSGTTPASGLLASTDYHIASTDAGSAAFSGIVSSATAGHYFHHKFVRSGGTAASPSTAGGSNKIGGLLGSVYDGTNLINSIALDFETESSVGSGSMPASMVVYTGANGTRTEKVRITESGRLQAGTPSGAIASTFTQSSPKMMILAESASAIFNGSVASATSTNRVVVQGFRSRGTIASPTTVSSGDSLFSINAGGYEGANMLTTGTITAIVDGTVSSGNVPLRWEINTSPTDGSGNVPRLTVKSNGQVQVNVTTASTSTTTGAAIVAGGLGVAGATYTATLNVGTGTTLDGIWSASATLDFPSIAANGGTQDLTITVTGASTGDSVAFSLPAAPSAGVVFNAWVSASNTVTVRATNCTAGAIDPASATYRATVFSH